MSDRPHAIVLAYACDPGAGSEEGAGWTWALAASRIASVTLVTNWFSSDRVEAAVRRDGLDIDVVTVTPPRWLRFTSRRRWGGFVYYVIWQRHAARAVRDIERRHATTVCHHVTWASDSLPSALRASRAPVRVWGPVGGSTGTHVGLYRYMRPRGRLHQVMRGVTNASFRRLAADGVARHATTVVAMNSDVAGRFRSVAERVVIEPNVALEPIDGPSGTPISDSGLRTALFVGRLIAWKGLLLAVRSLVHAPDWRLVVLGDGDDRDAAARLARELGVDHRVEFRGRVDRADVLGALSQADALLFPSFHDSAPWSVGEATALGCPVVCLDVGGVALVAADNAHVVPIADASTLPVRIGACLTQLDGRGERSDRWSVDRLPSLLRGWYGLDEPELGAEQLLESDGAMT